MAADPLTDFTTFDFTFEGKTRTVYRKGTGPGVVVMSEIPGITPSVADFARRVVDRGMTVFMPHLFGTPGKERSGAYIAQSIGWATCVSRDFATFALRRTSPAAEWCRGLARSMHEELGGPGVGAIGMCLTGGFALAMMADDSVIAPALSQPSLPFPFSAKHRRDLGVNDSDLARVKKRCEVEDVCVLGMRFTGDNSSPGDRFERLRVELGDRFIGVEIDSSKGNPHGNGRMAHSVVTEDLVDEAGHPTREALDQVLDFFTDRLQVSS